MSCATTRAVLLARRPRGAIAHEDFRLGEAPLAAPGEDEVEVRVELLSIDPYLRLMLDARPIVGEPVAIGAVMAGRGAGTVLASRSPRFAPGDRVAGEFGWRERAVVPAAGLRRLDPTFEPAWHLGVLGIPGATGWLALELIGAPREGEAVLVSSAAGAVGGAAGQIAASRGCRVIGIAGGAGKTHLLRERLGFHDAIDRHAHPDIARALREAAPEGVDILFDNVGGAFTDAVLPQLRRGGRVILCGNAGSHAASPAGAAAGGAPSWNTLALARHLRLQGFNVRDHLARLPEAVAALAELARAGRLVQVDTVIEGLVNAPRALAGLLAGEHVGKCVVRIA